MINKYIDIYEFQVVVILGKILVEGIEGGLDIDDVNGMVFVFLLLFIR